MMDNKRKPIIGKSYKIDENREVIYLGETKTPGRGLFLAPMFTFTPFVSWGYNIISYDRLDVYHGDYYRSLKVASKELPEKEENND